MKLNPQALTKITNQVNAAFVATVQEFAAECRNQITSEKWDWPRETERSNGKFVTSPRSIVDTGLLRDSQTQPLYRETEAGLQAEIRWNPIGEDGPYAAKVHNGEVVNGQVRPARPWVESALEEMGNGGFGRVFEREANRFVD